MWFLFTLTWFQCRGTIQPAIWNQRGVMSYTIKDPEAERILEVLSGTRRRTKADILRELLTQALEAEKRKVPLLERLRPLQQLAADTGPVLPMSAEEHKRRMDDLWGQGDNR
jgi:hypothetical protein